MNNYFIIDQINPYTGEFDEHKIVTGSRIKNAVDAALVYLSNYEPNWQGLGAISKATPHIYDLWLKYGNRKQPFSNSDFAEKPLHLALVGDAAPDPSKSRHWITTETGSHILINGNGEVVAGAGGKLSGRKFSVPAGSKDVSKHIETVEKIAQAGYEKHGGDKAEYLRMGRNKGSSAYFAREYGKKGLEGLPEGHLREALVDKPADNAAANGGQNSKPTLPAEKPTDNAKKLQPHIERGFNPESDIDVTGKSEKLPTRKADLSQAGIDKAERDRLALQQLLNSDSELPANPSDDWQEKPNELSNLGEKKSIIDRLEEAEQKVYAETNPVKREQLKTEYRAILKERQAEMKAEREAIIAQQQSKKEEVKKQEKPPAKAKTKTEPLDSRITKRDDGRLEVFVPRELYNNFKSNFSSSVWDKETKTLSVGNRSGAKLNAWLAKNLGTVEEVAKAKQEREAWKATKTEPLKVPYELKDEFKEKFNPMWGGTRDRNDKQWYVSKDDLDAAKAWIKEKMPKPTQSTRMPSYESATDPYYDSVNDMWRDESGVQIQPPRDQARKIREQVYEEQIRDFSDLLG